MDYPFYYTFQEFKDNYQNDFKKWLNENSTGTEVEYLDNLYSCAGYYVGYREFDQEDHRYVLSDMSFGAVGIAYEYDITNYVSIFIGVLESNFKEKFKLTNNKKVADFLYNFDGDFTDYVSHERFMFNNVIYQLTPFFYINKVIIKERVVYDDYDEPVKDERGETLFEEGEFGEGRIFFNFDRYILFLDEVKQINQFILEKINPEKEQENNTKVAIDEKSIFSIPEKIVLLEKLGVFAKLIKDGVSPENEYKIIQNLIGGSYSNVKKYCLNRKTKNKSSKDYQITEKHKNKIRNFYNSKTF